MMLPPLELSAARRARREDIDDIQEEFELRQGTGPARHATARSSPKCEHPSAKRLEAAAGDGLSHRLHQLQRPTDVVDADQPWAGRLADLEQVADVPTRVPPAHHARARGVERLLRQGVLGVLD